MARRELSATHRTAGGIRIAIKQAYEAMHARYGAVDEIDYHGMGQVVDAWLAAQGVP